MNGLLLDVEVLLKAKVDDIRLEIERAKREYESLQKVPDMTPEELSAMPEASSGHIWHNKTLYKVADIAHKQNKIKEITNHLVELDEKLGNWLESDRFKGYQTRQAAAQAESDERAKGKPARDEERRQQRVKVEEPQRPFVPGYLGQSVPRAPEALSDKELERTSDEKFQEMDAPMRQSASQSTPSSPPPRPKTRRGRNIGPAPPPKRAGDDKPMEQHEGTPLDISGLSQSPIDQAMDHLKDRQFKDELEEEEE